MFFLKYNRGSCLRTKSAFNCVTPIINSLVYKGWPLKTQNERKSPRLPKRFFLFRITAFVHFWAKYCKMWHGSPELLTCSASNDHTHAPSHGVKVQHMQQIVPTEDDKSLSGLISKHEAEKTPSQQKENGYSPKDYSNHKLTIQYHSVCSWSSWSCSLDRGR